MANNAMIEAARERAAKAERETRQECGGLHMPERLQRQVTYIESQIDLGTRDEKDLSLLRTRRREIMAEARRRRG